MNILLGPCGVSKKTIKLIDKDNVGKMSYSCRFEVKELFQDENKIIQIVKEKGDKRILDFNQKETKVVFYV